MIATKQIRLHKLHLSTELFRILPRYIKRLYAFNAFIEEDGAFVVITGQYNNVEQEHRLEGADAVKQLIEICAH